MSGTSADGVDAALVDIQGSGHRIRSKLLSHHARPYPPSLRKHILQVAERGSVDEVCHLNVVLGEIFAKSALAVIKKSGISPQRVRLIGSHGQTVYHRPECTVAPGVGKVRSTLQLGDPSVIAERTGLSVISDFRARDLAAGGEGAPLAPYVHALVFGKPRSGGLVINLGGIANVTVVPPAGQLHKVQAFDTGPCNMLLDGLVSEGTKGRVTCDRGGRLALKGKVHNGLVRKLLSHPYLQRRPPKSTGREMFGLRYVQSVWNQGQRLNLSLPDLLATSARFIAEGLDRSRQWVTGRVDEVVLGGGGVRNARLLKELSDVFQPAHVKKMEAYGIPSQAFEAQAFAVLAYQSLHGISANLPRVTGANRHVILGTLTPGKSGFPHAIRKKIFEIFSAKEKRLI